MTSPDQIRDDIQRTRDNLSSDVDALAYKASPSRMVHDRADRARAMVTGARNAVMGGASDLGNKTKSAAGAIADSATDAPAGVVRAAKGNPMAAVVIIFGATWLVSSLLPRSRREQQMATRLREATADHAGPVTDAARAPSAR